MRRSKIQKSNSSEVCGLECPGLFGLPEALPHAVHGREMGRGLRQLDCSLSPLVLQAPFKDRPEYVHCAKLAEDIADLLAPQSGAYYDIWLDGEKFVSAQMEVSGHAPLRPCLCSPPALPCLKTMLHYGHQCAECAAVQEAVTAAEARLCLQREASLSVRSDCSLSSLVCAHRHLMPVLPACAAPACGSCAMLGKLKPRMAMQSTMHGPYHSSGTICRTPK